MKTTKLSKRIIAFVLTLVMMLSIIPLNVFAALNDIVTGANKGYTGIQNDTLGQNGSINWPIKVYDYLADGMLFEFSNTDATDLTSKTLSGTEGTGGGQYVLGSPVPYPQGANIVTDFTTDEGYNQWDTKTRSSFPKADYKKTWAEAENYESPRHLHVTYNPTYSFNNYGMYVPLTNLYNVNGGNVGFDKVRYVTIVYRSNGITDKNGANAFQLIACHSNGTTVDIEEPVVDFFSGEKMSDTEGAWNYVVMDLYKHVGYKGGVYAHSAHMSFIMDSPSDYVDIAQVAYFSDSGASLAKEYGEKCVLFNNDPGEYVSGTDWIAGNNNGFGLRWPANGPGNPKYHHGGNPNTTESGTYASYYNSMIGYQDERIFTGNAVGSNVYNNNRKDGRNPENNQFNNSGYLIGNNGIHYVDQDWNLGKSSSFTGFRSTANDGQAPVFNSEYFDTSVLDFKGYNLLTKFKKGIATMGMLDNSLDKKGRPVYRQYAVEYVGDLLSKTLTIPQKNPAGKNIYTYIAGVKNAEQYGTDKNGNARDLAQALRDCIGIDFSNNNSTTGRYNISRDQTGDYATTIAKADKLVGSFKDCEQYIDTCVDAAYYLLHNLYVPDSYNQAQDDFSYLNLKSTKLEDGTEAFVFDGGFTTNDSSNLTNQADYKANSESSVVYDTASGVISLGKAVGGKDLYYYSSKNDITTRFPFLPVVDSEGVYAGQSDSYYFAEGSKRSYDEAFSTYRGRNFHYTAVCNGEFVFNEEDNLFFEFEGDDDVYLFINGELVLDLGGAHPIATCSLNVNDYVKWAREVLANPSGHTQEELDRAEELDLVDGEIADFDFYYMERHGYGANMRIVTNMQITDPNMRVEKKAYQFGEQVELGGLVDPDTPLEYNFKLKNTGNQKLFNLTFEDSNIGVTLDPTNGLTVEPGKNKIYVKDVQGNELDAQDLTAVVTGYKPVEDGTGDYKLNKETREYTKVAVGEGTHVYVEVEVHFKDNEELKNFLHTLQGDGLESGGDYQTEVTQQGAGLWVDADVTFKGIHYLLTDEQVESGKFENTVYVTANTEPDSSGETLRSQASHRVYIAGVPYYYQWAGHNLYIDREKIYVDSVTAAQTEGNRLEDHVEFFRNNTLNTINVYFCDKYGKIDDNLYKDEVTATTKNNKPGYYINYKESGVNEFYLLMVDKNNDSSKENLDALTKSQYAIVRIMVYTAEVNDSTIVLDYGLKTEELDTNGELFKNDNLLGAQNKTEAKVMGVSTSENTKYLDPKTNNTIYNQIDFTAQNDLDVIPVYGTDGKQDGFYKLNMDIPTNGKVIIYNANTGKYSLTQQGTVTMHANVPDDWGIVEQSKYEATDKVNIYYWYSNGASNGWPGNEMKYVRPGNFTFDIPSDVPYVIINHEVTYKNGTSASTTQTVDINVNPGEEAWINIDEANMTDGKYVPNVEYHNSKTTINVKPMAADEWSGDYYVYAWEGQNNEVAAWPGTKITSEVNDDGYLSIDLPGYVTNVVINNGTDAQPVHKTQDISVYAGKETWIEIDPCDFPGVDDNGNSIYVHTAVTKLSIETVPVHAKVPATWTTPYIYYWQSNGGATGIEWPGLPMTKGADGYYNYDIPSGTNEIIINNGGVDQTGNIAISGGLETWLEISADDPYATVEANVPNGYGDVYFYFYNDKTGTSVGGSWPGEKVEPTNGKYVMDAPLGATSVIVNNGNGVQTQDLMLIPGTSASNKKLNVVNVNPNGTAAFDTNLIISAPYGGQSTYVGYKTDKDAADYTYGRVQNENGNIIFSLSSVKDGIVSYVIADGQSANANRTAELKKFYIGTDTRVTVAEDNTASIAPATDIRDLSGFNVKITYGKEQGGEDEGITFTPTDFMDSKYSIWMAVVVHETKDFTPSTLESNNININKEVQMFKKITVLPANVVYYEDDFEGIKYDTTTENKITHIGNGSGKLSQNINQDQEYGKEPTYQKPNRTDNSAEGHTQVTVKDTKAFASFTFTGTGFEIIGRTFAVNPGTAMVKIKDQTGNVVRTVAVITEYDNKTNGSAADSEAITQVPIIRVDDLTFGTYTIEISGVPAYDFSNFKPGATLPVKDSYIVIDGIRVFQPLQNGGVNGSDTDYKDEENAAKFSEVRSLIENKQAFAVKYSEQDGLVVSGGTNTWTENRNGFIQGDNEEKAREWNTNTVASVSDYLLVGPNNEVYMQEVAGNDQTALAFYVKETNNTKDVHDIQIAARALDNGMYYGNTSTGLNAQLQYGSTDTDGKMVWKDLATVKTGTEQYYTIPYEDCLYDSKNSRYQVVIRVADTAIPGMVSFTSLKYNGLEILKVNDFNEGDIVIEKGEKEDTISVGGLMINNKDSVDFVELASQMATTKVKSYNSDELMFTVVFQDADGKVYDTQVVKYGEDAKAPTRIAKAADEFYTYVFAGWDIDYRNVVCDLVVTAEFDAIAIDQDKVAYEEYKGYDVNSSSNNGSNSAKAQDVYDNSFSAGFGTNKK